MTQASAAVRRWCGKGLHKKTADSLPFPGVKGKTNSPGKKLREYLEPPEVEALIKAAPNPTARLCMMLQWHAGLRVGEAIRVKGSAVHLEADPPELKVRQGKGRKDRIVPLHPKLAGSLENAIAMWKGAAGDPLIGTTRQRAWQWYKVALKACYAAGTIPEGKPCGTHTLRHSAARYWLLNDVPINVVSKWLGHSNLQTTMVYLELVADPGGFMERVP